MGGTNVKANCPSNAIYSSMFQNKILSLSLREKSNNALEIEATFHFRRCLGDGDPMLTHNCPQTPASAAAPPSYRLTRLSRNTTPTSTTPRFLSRPWNQHRISARHSFATVSPKSGILDYHRPATNEPSARRYPHPFTLLQLALQTVTSREEEI